MSSPFGRIQRSTQRIQVKFLVLEWHEVLLDFLDSAVFPFGRKQKQHSVTEKMMLTSSLKESSKNIRSAESYTVL